MRDRRLVYALGLSLALHLAVAGAPGWPVPAPEDELIRVIEARLAAPVPPPAKAAPAPAPRPQPPRPAPRKPTPPATPDLPRASVGAAAPVPAPEPPPVEPLAQAEPAPAAPPPAETAPAPAPAPLVQEPPGAEAGAPLGSPDAPAVSLPAAGRIRYAVTRGDIQFELGQAVHTWVLEGDRYLLRATHETTGIAALFHRAEVRQTSRGALGPEGLQPVEFRSERGGRVTEQAAFDWQRGRLYMVGGGKHGDFALAPGSQDLLSVFYQLVMFPPATRSETMVATGKGYAAQTFERVGEAELETRIGTLRTLHLRRVGENDTLELWLALEHHRLPVRISWTDRKGEISDLRLVELEYPGVRLAADTSAPVNPRY